MYLNILWKNSTVIILLLCRLPVHKRHRIMATIAQNLETDPCKRFGAGATGILRGHGRSPGENRILGIRGETIVYFNHVVETLIVKLHQLERTLMSLPP